MHVRRTKVPNACFDQLFSEWTTDGKGVHASACDNFSSLSVLLDLIEIVGKPCHEHEVGDTSRWVEYTESNRHGSFSS